MEDRGRLVIPVGGSDTQVMKKIVRKVEDEFETTEHSFAFVPMLKGVSGVNYKE
ncbi:MAG: hypothetical protein R2744_07965 [Bacteroidales bacterium]